MRMEQNVDLSAYTTFKMGGSAKRFWTPESKEELTSLLSELPKPHYLLGGGSNILINDKKIFENVINLRCFSDELGNIGNGIYKVGASVRLQKLITTINQDGYGGIEYLYSVPGLVGGAIYMNAGRGEKYKKALSDYLIEVEVLYKGEKQIIKKEECGFTYRHSVFQEDDYIILSAIFQFEKAEIEKVEKLRRERIQLCKETQDNSKPNFGTVFCVSDKHIMKVFEKTKIGKKGGVCYSKKTVNWMLNQNNGCFEDALVLLERVERVHNILRKSCKREVKIWR